MDVLIKNMTLPTDDEQVNITILSDGSVIEHFRNESGKWSSYRSGGVTAIELPPHGRLIDVEPIEKEVKTWTSAGLDKYDFLYELDHAEVVVEAST